MKRTRAFALLAAVTCFLAAAIIHAEENVPPSGYLYFSPKNSSGTIYRYRKVAGDTEVNREADRQASQSREKQLSQVKKQPSPQPILGNLRESLRRRPLFFRRSESQFATPVSLGDAREPVAARPVSQPTSSALPVARSGQPVVRPVSYGVRYSLGSMYPASIYGQTAQANTQPGTGYPAASGAAPGYPTSINPEKYSYASRSNGACCDGTAYSPIYNSGYYTSGCYESNACCRTSRRQCTLFGGLFRGCGCSCYSPPPPPCPTTCYVDPCYGPMGGATYYAPPAYGTPTPVPTTKPAPPAPGNPIDNAAPPQPIEKKVTPAPQANLSPRIPGLPPDA